MRRSKMPPAAHISIPTSPTVSMLPSCAITTAQHPLLHAPRLRRPGDPCRNCRKVHNVDPMQVVQFVQFVQFLQALFRILSG
jgi:hypothetical protein